MNVLKRYQIFLILSVGGCLISGLAFGLIPLVEPDSSVLHRVLSILIALLFWLGLICEFVFFAIANKCCKMIEAKLVQKRRKSFTKSRAGIITFFSSPEATVVDVFAFITLIAFVLMIVLQVSAEWLIVLVAVLFYYSFTMHCFLNGKNYKYLKEFQKYFKKQGDKKDE
ncbi:MAG: hypothetical protein IKM24_05235 [Clostridia bacterium]|nr:hypothetical protein [Clostridia bacterium]